MVNPEERGPQKHSLCSHQSTSWKSISSSAAPSDLIHSVVVMSTPRHVQMSRHCIFIAYFPGGSGTTKIMDKFSVYQMPCHGSYSTILNSESNSTLDILVPSHISRQTNCYDKKNKNKKLIASSFFSSLVAHIWPLIGCFLDKSKEFSREKRICQQILVWWWGQIYYCLPF